MSKRKEPETASEGPGWTKKSLVRQTITGADDNVVPGDLLALSDQYPFVEWGVLLAKRMFGKPKHPSREWLASFSEAKEEHKTPISRRGFSMHICDDWVLALAETGSTEVFDKCGKELSDFDRIQLNFSRSIKAGKLDKEKLFKTLSDLSWRAKGAPAPTFIFQLPSLSPSHVCLVEEALANGILAEPFFDLSGGRGILPDSWPFPYDGGNDEDPRKLRTFGYSGGLSPANIQQHLELLTRMAAGQEGRPPFEFWVDLETRVRCEADKFDLEKCRQVLDISKNFLRLKL